MTIPLWVMANWNSTMIGPWSRGIIAAAMEAKTMEGRKKAGVGRTSPNENPRFPFPVKAEDLRRPPRNPALLPFEQGAGLAVCRVYEAERPQGVRRASLRPDAEGRFPPDGGGSRGIRVRAHRTDRLRTR